MGNFKLYFTLVYSRIKSEMYYPVSFIMTVLSTFMASFIDVIGLYLIFIRFKMIDGWILAEIFLLYGLLHMGFAIVEAFARGLDMLSSLIRRGDFDRLLVRPRFILVQVMGSDFKLSNIGKFLQGLLPFIYGLSVIKPFDLWQISLMFLALFNITLLYFALLLLQASLSFYTVEGLEVMNAFTYGGLQMGHYPLTIYEKWFARFFTYIVPIALSVYFPVLVILEKTGDVYYNSAPLLIGAGPLIIGLFLLIAFKVFHKSIKHYTSTGS